MKPLFEADTVLTYKAYEKLSWATRPKPDPLVWNGLVLVAMVLVLDAVLYFTGNTTLANFGFCAAVAIPFVLIYRERRALRKAWKNNPALHNVRIHYVFYKDHLEQSSAIGSSSYEYKRLARVIEKRSAFYLFPSSRQGLILDKKGCSEELCAFIRKVS